jgi:hypothetical protein
MVLHIHVMTNYTVQCTYVDVIKEEEVTGSEVKMENGTAEVSENGTQEKGEFPDTNNFIEFHLFCSDLVFTH